jgi:hypothetical protein
MRRSLFAIAFLGALFPLSGIAPSQRQISYTQFLPLATWQKQFQIIEGKDRGRVVPFVFERDAADGKIWSLTFGDYARAMLRRDADGGLILDRLDLIKAKDYIVYDPPLPLFPSEGGAGPALRETNYKMYSAETGRLKRSGRATHEIKRVLPWKFSTPAGIIDGYYVEIEHGMDMEYHSHLQMTLGLGCRLDEGPIYGSSHYNLKKLGVFTETKTAVAALAKP